MDYQYELLAGKWCACEQSRLQEISDFYSQNYGIWSSADPKQRGGEKIKLSPERLKVWLNNEDTYLAEARNDSRLIGYAIATQKKEREGRISWVTQLVVHEDYRNEGVGRSLLFCFWSFSNYFAWGLCTANPFAVRALEKSTRRQCVPMRIKKNHRKLINFGIRNVSYIDGDTKYIINNERSTINTNFFVDHSEVGKWIKDASSDRDWLLGELEEGWEWFAFTFQDQSIKNFSHKEIEQILKMSDDRARKAYSRMTLDTEHKWAKHGEKEAQWIVEYCRLKPGSKILDVGCGIGRHAIELGKHGYYVDGVDYIKSFIDRANSSKKQSGLDNVSFDVKDSRTLSLGKEYDSVLCLYDVIGSYADDAENNKIIDSLYSHLKDGGFALVSVMNYELTEKIAKNIFEFESDPNDILKLNASDTMEKTGDIFNPEHFILDKKTRVVYRREQFSSKDAKIPDEELIVRDRRYARIEIEDMFRVRGFKVVWSRYVRAGEWDKPLEATEGKAKEILLLCQKRVNPIKRLLPLFLKK